MMCQTEIFAADYTDYVERERGQRKPALVAHADWGVRPAKRWLAVATLGADGRYTLDTPCQISNTATLLAELTARAAGGGVLLGVDFPLGVPLPYAQRAGIDDFAAWLPQIGYGRWARVGDVAEEPAQIALERPFYPLRPGCTRREYLLAGLGLMTVDELRRWCDHATERRRAAAPLFWTIGAQQVGKAALAGWRELLQPALADPACALGLWPFDGPLATLLAERALVVAEAYPGEYYHQLGLTLRGSKRHLATRRAAAGPLQSWAATAGVRLSAGLVALLAAGCGDDEAAEDRFDALVAVCGVLGVVLGLRAARPPLPRAIRRVEGWILGQTDLPAGPVVSSYRTLATDDADDADFLLFSAPPVQSVANLPDSPGA